MHRYKVRYTVDITWNKPTEGNPTELIPGVKVADSDVGFADDLFIVSVMRDEDGQIASMLPLDTVGQGGFPDPELLDSVVELLLHYQKHHRKGK